MFQVTSIAPAPVAIGPYSQDIAVSAFYLSLTKYP